MKIFKYSFTPEKIVTDKKTGEPRVIKGKKRKLFFAYTHESNGIFEELFEKPLLSIVDIKDKKNETENFLKVITDKKFILCLAASSYLEMQDGKYCNSIFNADKFIDTEGIEILVNDMDFITGLIDCVFDSLPSSGKKGTKETFSNNHSKKKRY